MCACYLGFLAVVVDRTDFADHATDHDGIHEPRRAVAWLACGLALVLVGGHLLVTEGRAFALAVGLPSYFVGAITGLGTTIPEIVVALQAVREGESGIAVGTLLGSNVTDPLFSLGFGAAVGGLHVAHVHRILSPAATCSPSRPSSSPSSPSVPRWDAEPVSSSPRSTSRRSSSSSPSASPPLARGVRRTRFSDARP
ncbi:sodium:calcium antiporter [Halarchaeum acidiphilum]|nr:hypothetical protein [Halarchaeum acidiphilum]